MGQEVFGSVGTPHIQKLYHSFCVLPHFNPPVGPAGRMTIVAQSGADVQHPAKPGRMTATGGSPQDARRAGIEGTLPRRGVGAAAQSLMPQHNLRVLEGRIGCGPFPKHGAPCVGRRAAGKGAVSGRKQFLKANETSWQCVSCSVRQR